MRPMNLIYQQPSFYVLVHKKKKISGGEKNVEFSGYKVSSSIAYKGHDGKNYLAKICENIFHVYKSDNMKSDNITTFEITPFIEFLTPDGSKCVAHINNMSFIITKSPGDSSIQNADYCVKEKEYVSDSISYTGWYDNHIVSSFAQWAEI